MLGYRRSGRYEARKPSPTRSGQRTNTQGMLAALGGLSAGFWLARDSASAQTPEPCESVPAASGLGLGLFAALLVGAGVLIILRARQRGESVTGPTALFIVAMMSMPVCLAVATPAAAQPADCMMFGVKDCKVTLRLTSFGIQQDTGDVGPDDGWEIYSSSPSVDRPTAKRTPAAPADAPTSQGFAGDSALIGQKTIKFDNRRQNGFQVPVELRSTVVEQDDTANRSFETHETSPPKKDAQLLSCPMQPARSVTVELTGAGSDQIDMPIPLVFDVLPIAPSKTGFQVTVTYHWTVEEL